MHYQKNKKNNGNTAQSKLSISLAWITNSACASVFVYSCLPVFMLDYLCKMKRQRVIYVQ